MDNSKETSNQQSRLKAGQPAMGFVLLVVLIGHFSRAAGALLDSAPQPALPKFSVPGGIYTSNISVRLTGGSPPAALHYTVDGSEPTAASPKYSRPIEIADTTLLKAKSFDSGSASSATVSQTYIMTDPELAAFSSNLPLVIIESFGQHIPHGQKVQVSVRFIDSKGGRSTLAGSADFDGRGDINVRGNTSLRYPKHSYHFKTKDEAHNPLKVSILGFPKHSDWILYAPYPDKTLMRDVLAYELSNKIGRYAPRTKFVEVFVNESGSRLTQRHYVGVYVFEEKIRRGQNRVDIEKLEPEDNTEPNVSGGFIFKKDHFDSEDMQDKIQAMQRHTSSPIRPWFRTSQGQRFLYVEPEADEITPQQRAWLTRYVNRFEAALYGNSFKDPKTGYAAYIDPDSFIDHHLLVELTKNIDGFRFSTFYYKDRGGKINMGPLWDWNLSLGNANGKEGWIPENWYWPQLDDQQYSWFRRLFEDPDFAQKYVDRWGQLRTNQFAIANLHARIDQLAELLNEAQARNFRRWRILGRNISPNSYVGRSFSEEVNWMKQWIDTRVAWIDTQFLAAPSLSLKAGPVDHGSKLLFRAASGKVYFTIDGTDPRAPGGAVSPAARSSSALVLNDSVLVLCRAYRDNRWSYPAAAKFTVRKSPSGKEN